MHKYLYLTLITLAEATIGVFVKLTGDSVPVFTLNFYRVFFAFLFLLATVPFIKKDFWRLDQNNAKPIVIIGIFIVLQISLFNIAMTLAPIANVVIFWSIAPFFVFIFSYWFLNERAQKQHIFIFIIALTGIIIAKPLKTEAIWGNLTALTSGISYAALVSYMRYMGKSESPSMVVWFMAIASLILLPTLFIFGPGSVFKLIDYAAIDMKLPILLWVICLGVFSTGVAYLFISLVLRNLTANVYSLVDIIVSPIVASLLGYLIFNEVPSINMIFGGLLLLASGFWLNREMET